MLHIRLIHNVCIIIGLLVFQICNIASIVKNSIDLNESATLGADYQTQLRDQNADCTTGANKDTWWCKAIVELVVTSTFFSRII